MLGDFQLYLRRKAKENLQGTLVRLSFEKGGITDTSEARLLEMCI